MYTVFVIFHIVACMALILIVLLQTGRGAEMGAAFGGASQTLFGGSGGSTFLSKLTTGAAIVFMITCLVLTYMSSAPKTSSIMENVPVEKPQGPALPEAKPVPPGAQSSAPNEGVAAPQAGDQKAPAPQSQAAPQDQTAPGKAKQ